MGNPSRPVRQDSATAKGSGRATAWAWAWASGPSPREPRGWRRRTPTTRSGTPAPRRRRSARARSCPYRCRCRPHQPGAVEGVGTLVAPDVRLAELGQRVPHRLERLRVREQPVDRAARVVVDLVGSLVGGLLGFPERSASTSMPARHTGHMSEQPTTVTTDGLESWNDAVRRAEHGETVVVITHGRHVADVVPSGEVE